MGGDISVKSELGIGTNFEFNINVNLAESTKIESKKTRKQVMGLASNQPQYRILVVDDNWTNRQLVVKLLKPLGFEIQEAENGQEAILLWERWQPHLIFMDMRMPVMNGYEATQSIKQHLHGQATVIIALTASVLQQEQSVILSAGCDDFVRKPFQVDVLFEKIAKHLGVRFLYEENLTELSPGETLSQNSQSTQITHLSQLTPEALGVMPQSWIQDLNQAATQLNHQLVLNAIDQIPQNHASLSQVLTQLANDFRYDIIIDLTQNPDSNS